MLCGRPVAAAYPNKPHYTIAADKKQRENGPGRKSGVLSGRVGCGRTAVAGGKISACCRKKSLDEMRRIEYDNGSESEGVNDMSEEYGNDLVTVLDDEGNEHQFEVLDAIENDDGRYVALLPVYTDAEAEVEGDGELVILEVVDQDGEDLLVPIEDDDTFEEIAGVFEERLADYYEINEEEEPQNPVS